MPYIETTWLAVGAVAVLLGCSAFFSSSEIAIFSLPTVTETDTTPTDAPDRRSETLARLREDPHRLLVTLLVGNNVVNVAISSIITVVLVERLPAGQAVAAATIGASFTVLLFGEILPKAYGLGNAEKVSLAVARPIRVVGLLLLPLVVVFDGLTRRASGVLGVDAGIERPYTDDDSARK